MSAETTIDVESRVIPAGEESAQPDVIEEKPVVALVVVEHAIARFDPTEKILADLRIEVAEGIKTHDINTTAGEDALRKLRQRVISVRTGADKLYTELNRPMLDAAKKMREKVAAIKDAVKPLEDPLDKLISAREEAREIEKQRKIKEEQDRINALREKITAISKIPAAALKMTIEQLQQQLLDLQSIVINDDTFAEFLDEAEVLRNETVTQVNELLQTKQRDAAERARVARESAALEEQRQAAALAADLQAKIMAINGTPLQGMGKNAAELTAILAGLQAPDSLVFGEMLPLANAAYDSATTMLGNMIATARAAEKTAADQAERQRHLDEQEAEAARQREADQQRLDQQREELAEKQRQIDLANTPTPAPTPEPTAAPTPAPTPEPSPEPTPCPTMPPSDPVERHDAMGLVEVVMESYQLTRSEVFVWLLSDALRTELESLYIANEEIPL